LHPLVTLRSSISLRMMNSARPKHGEQASGGKMLYSSALVGTKATRT
jgi:hypothetical protein